MSYEIAETAVVYPGTVIGEGCKIGDHAVVGAGHFANAVRAASMSARPRELDDRHFGFGM